MAATCIAILVLAFSASVAIALRAAYDAGYRDGSQREDPQDEWWKKPYSLTDRNPCPGNMPTRPRRM